MQHKNVPLFLSFTLSVSFPFRVIASNHLYTFMFQVNQPYLIFDHCPNVLVIPKIVQARRKSFKFVNLVADKEDFLPVVGKKWCEEYAGCQMFKTRLKDQLKDVQVRIDKEPNKKELRVEEALVLDEYVAALKDEEKFLYQKAKVKWLSEGDRNNAFFHKVLKSRSHRSKISTICDDMGNKFSGNDVASKFVKHFEGFLGCESPVKDLSPISALFKNKLSMEEASFMVRGVTDKEIKEAMFQIDGNKAPGPDGFTSHFFKKAWDIVGGDICSVIKEFFTNGKLLKEINSTLISLVPKIQTPSKVTDFRPIACCNVIYKCISKIITDRMKGSLDKLVDHNQSAFVPNRHIHDNILLSQELLKGYDRKDGPNRVAMKVDIQKANDTVNWKFLEAILREFGFHEKMVEWITQCITTASFSICVNGERFSYFKGGRGLRQGDPMSPYLFTLVMEVLTLIGKNKVDKNKEFKYHFGCKNFKLTHVCFVDDLLMFCNGDVGSVNTLKEAIEDFRVVSGLMPNYNKSTIIFGSMSSEDKLSILEAVPFKVKKLPVRYLGVPLTSKRIGVNDCKILIDKIKGRVNNWKNKCLSYAGRLQLIASILESIHVYWASVFLLPLTVVKDINKILKGFLWNHGDISKGKAKVAWKNICRPKCQGGLGLKDLNIWNKAMLTKHLWQVAMEKKSLWVKWTSVEKLKGRSVWVINEEANDSWGWKNILKLRDEVRGHIVMKIGNGEKAKVVYDNWSSIGILQYFITQRDIYDVRLNANMVVKDLVSNGVCNWPMEWIFKFPILIQQSHVLNIHKKDELIWKSREGKECMFSVKQAYEDLSCQYATVKWKNLVWFTQNIPKHAFILWMAILNKLSTQDKAKIEVTIADMGWNEIVERFSQMYTGNSNGSIIRRIGLAASVYLIWKERNCRIFKDEKKSVRGKLVRKSPSPSVNGCYALLDDALLGPLLIIVDVG
ncbi:RNA-directed DNA polymerase, eukaryota, reverse transcriptase zinc-binding domain protein [Tanacetum coccineum]